MSKIEEIISEYDIEQRWSGYLSDYSHQIKKMMIDYAEWYTTQNIDRLFGGYTVIDKSKKTIKHISSNNTLSIETNLLNHE